MKLPRQSRLSSLVLAATTSSLLMSDHVVSAAYDIGCIYPEAMPDPFQVERMISGAFSLFSVLASIETPIVIHKAHGTSLCNMNCLAYHDPMALNALTLERPTIETPAFVHNAFSITMCMAECYNVLTGGNDRSPLGVVFEKWDLPVTGLQPEVVAAARHADENPNILARLVRRRDYHPLLIGQLVALEILQHQRDDGWNGFGTMRYDAESDSAVECTANCQPYADTTGYYPRNNPTRQSDFSIQAKYLVQGNDKYWQPLLDGDMAGYFSHQSHVTPHIGLTAKTIFPVDPSKESPDPEYDYRREALQVVDELRETARSPERQSKIELFDNKLYVRGVIQYAARDQWEEVHPFQKHLGFIHGLSSAEHDAVLMSWREKVRHDLVRPTTVIQRWGSDELETYNGVRTSTRPETIKARDFQAWQRVMPHSEYPSGSACLCTAYAELTDLFQAGMYPDQEPLQNLEMGGDNGFQINCDGEHRDLKIQVGCRDRDEYSFENMSDLAHQCGQSRLWGGMHFSKSVPAAEELCTGLGAQAYDQAALLENGSDWGGNPFYVGDARPVCGEQEQS